MIPKKPRRIVTPACVNYLIRAGAEHTVYRVAVKQLELHRTEFFLKS